MVASALQKQLTQLAGGHRQETRLRKVASFLFEDKVAQEVSTSQCQKIGVRGLKGLAQLDPRFNHFFSTLFDESSLEAERAVMAPEEARDVDNELELFLWLVSPHFLSSCAHEALEYLLRHYEVHIVLTESVLRAVMPYHNHLFFARMVQLLPLRNTRWSFLWALQRSGRPLTRSLLVQHTQDDQSLLSQICEWTQDASERETAHPALLSLYNALVVELIAEFQKGARGASDQFVAVVLPTAETLVAEGTTLDAQASGYAALAALFATTPLARDVCVAVFRKLLDLMAKPGDGTPRVPPQHVLKVLALVASQLPDDVVLKAKEKRTLLHQSWDSLAADLEALQHSSEGSAFLSILLNEMLQDAIKSSGRRMTTFTYILTHIDLSERLATKLAVSCLDAVAAGAEGGEVLAKVLGELERNNCKGFDAALKHVLQRVSGDKKKVLFDWLRSKFAAAGGATGDRGVVVSDGTDVYTLSVACLHHEPAVRNLAATEILKKLADAKGGAAGDVRSLLVRMLDLEEDPQVLATLLGNAAVCDMVDLDTALPAVASLAAQHSAEPTPAVTPLVADTLARFAAKAEKSGAPSFARYYTVLAIFAATLLLGASNEKSRKKYFAGLKKLLGATGGSPLALLGLGLRGDSVESVAAKLAEACAASDALRGAFSDVLAESAKRAATAASDAEKSVIDGRVVVCLMALCTGSKAETLVAVMGAVREHMASTLRGSKLHKALTGAADVSSVSAAVAAAKAEDRAKVAYLSLLAGVSQADLSRASSLSEKTVCDVLADCFHWLSVAAEDDAACTALSSALLSALLAKAPAPLKVVAKVWTRGSVAGVPSDALLLRSFELVAVVLAAKKKQTGAAHLAAALLCILTRAQSPAVLKGMSELLLKLATHVDAETGDFLKALAPRLQAATTENVSSLVVNLLTSDNVTNELCCNALEWELADLATVMRDVVSMARVRGSMPTLAAVFKSDVVTHEMGVLVGAAADSFRAVFELTPAQWAALPDKSTVLDLLCRCLQTVKPIAVPAPEGSSAAPTMLSLPDRVAGCMLAGAQPVPGFKPLFDAFDQGERQQVLDSLLLLVSNGHAAGRRILDAASGVVGARVREHAAVLAGRWCKKLSADARLSYERAAEGDDGGDESSVEEAVASRKRKAPAAAGGEGAKRARHEDAHALPLCRAVETLMMLHPGKGLPLAGQDPVATAALAWRCLRVEAAKRKSDRSTYMMSMFASLLAACAAEVAACAAQVRAAKKTLSIDTLVPGFKKASRVGVLAPANGLCLVELEEMVEVLQSTTNSVIRREGMRTLQALIAVAPAEVYTACLQFVVASVGLTSVDDMLEEMLTNLIPGLLSTTDGGSLVTLIHIVLYSYASRRGNSEAALDACHGLLSRCNVHYQLIALNKLLMLTVANSERSGQEEQLLASLHKYHPAQLTPEQIELRVILFALRHLVSDTFIDAVLDMEDAQRGEAAYYEGFSAFFLCLLRMYRQSGAPEEEEAGSQAGDDASADEEVEEDEEAEEQSSQSSALSDAGDARAARGGDAVVDDLYDLRVPALDRIKQLLVAVVDIMPVPVFVAAIQVLLGDSGLGLRTLGLRLFNSKLETMGGRLSNDDSLAFVTMLPELHDALSSPAAAFAADPVAVQSSLWTLEILTRHLAPLHPRSFAHFLPCLTEVVNVCRDGVRASSPPACAVTASAILTLGHICHEVEALSLEHIPKVMPLLLGVCGDATQIVSKLGLSRPKPAVKQLLNSSLSSTSKVLLKVSQYLSPYYRDIVQLATSRGTVAASQGHGEKLLATLLKAAPSRLLFPAITEVWHHPRDSTPYFFDLLNNNNTHLHHHRRSRRRRLRTTRTTCSGARLPSCWRAPTTRMYVLIALHLALHTHTHTPHTHRS